MKVKSSNKDGIDGEVEVVVVVVVVVKCVCIAFNFCQSSPDCQCNASILP